jgi:hypothetical protein
VTPFDTDYLVIGAGATGLAFADTLLEQSDAHITLVDRQAQPGGHWGCAYPFVRLHQPSAFYGVNSLALGSGRKDTQGHNAGLYELASGAEVSGYFHQVVHQRLLPSGRVRYLPMANCLGVDGGEARIAHLLSGQETRVTVRRRTVDATFFSPDVPANTRPRYRVADGVRLVTPTQLTQLWRDGDAPPVGYCIVGAGKTAMDVGIWLLDQGAAPESITWVVPRDSWVVNRLTTQPGDEFFEYAVGGQMQQMKALAEASDVEDLFDRLEASGQMLRIDRAHRPRMFHYATLSEGEVRLLRRITRLIRRGRVLAIEPEALQLEQGRETMPAGTVYIDCTASAVRPRPSHPIFQPGRITPQLVRAPLVTFSAAVCAYVEIHAADDAAKNLLCTPVPFPRDVAGYIAATLVSLANQMRWNQDKPLRTWMRNSRLDGFGKMTASVDPGDTGRLALLGELRQQAGAAAINARRLLASHEAAHRDPTPSAGVAPVNPA